MQAKDPARYDLRLPNRHVAARAAGMTFHIVLPRRMQLAEVAAQATAKQVPRHALWLLAQDLAATLHEPDDSRGRPIDRVRAAIAPPISLWALAERVHAQAAPGHVVFCSSEAGGLQLAAVGAGHSHRPRLAVFVHNVDRPRSRLALKWWRMAQSVDLFLACSVRQVEFLRDYLGLPEDRVRHVWDHTDTTFFTAGPKSPEKRRPLIVSVGLEQRDYKTLAAATHDLDVDVRISGVSKDAAALARIFPDPLPTNMSRRFYGWPDLVQLYRDADVVVVSCHENKYAAGVQSLMEAMACARPVVASTTEGLAAYLDESVTGFTPGDAGALRAAILATLGDPVAAQARADLGHATALRRFAMERYLTEVAAALRALAA
jgi:glycosyltransferase involved in cell wall biosynthesis